MPEWSTKSVLQVREQRQEVFVDLATWNDSLLLRYNMLLMGHTQFRRGNKYEQDLHENVKLVGLGKLS